MKVQEEQEGEEWGQEEAKKELQVVEVKVWEEQEGGDWLQAVQEQWEEEAKEEEGEVEHEKEAMFVYLYT